MSWLYLMVAYITCVNLVIFRAEEILIPEALESSSTHYPPSIN